MVFSIKMDAVICQRLGYGFFISAVIVFIIYSSYMSSRESGTLSPPQYYSQTSLSISSIAENDSRPIHVNPIINRNNIVSQDFLHYLSTQTDISPYVVSLLKSHAQKNQLTVIFQNAQVLARIVY